MHWNTVNWCSHELTVDRQTFSTGRRIWILAKMCPIQKPLPSALSRIPSVITYKRQFHFKNTNQNPQVYSILYTKQFTASIRTNNKQPVHSAHYLLLATCSGTNLAYSCVNFAVWTTLAVTVSTQQQFHVPPTVTAPTKQQAAPYSCSTSANMRPSTC